MTAIKRGLKLWGYHLLIAAVSSVFLVFPIFQNTLGLLIVTALMLVFYVPLIYSTAWDYGDWDQKPYHHVKIRKLSGFGYGLLAAVPGLLVVGALAIVRLMASGTPTDFIVTFGASLYHGMFAILTLGLPHQPVGAHVLPLLVMPLLAGFGYYHGTKQFDLLEIINEWTLYGGKKKKKKDAEGEKEKSE